LEAKYNVLNAPTEYEFEERATNHDKPASKDSKTTATKPSTKKPQVVKTSTRPPVDVSISVRVERDWCEFSLDAVSGQGGELHRRGYRPLVTERSLRETLAASVLHAIIPSSNVQGAATNSNDEVVLWDPMCGTGILPIEAAMLMHNTSVIPPSKQLSKQFAFQDWLSFDAKAYERCLQSAAIQANQSAKNIQWVPFLLFWFSFSRSFQSFLESAEIRWL
jgi:23S rRNA G2445 N2-methylase RlmL